MNLQSSSTSALTSCESPAKRGRQSASHKCLRLAVSLPAFLICYFQFPPLTGSVLGGRGWGGIRAKGRVLDSWAGVESVLGHRRSVTGPFLDGVWWSPQILPTRIPQPSSHGVDPISLPTRPFPKRPGSSWPAPHRLCLLGSPSSPGMYCQ